MTKRLMTKPGSDTSSNLLPSAEKEAGAGQ